MNHHIDNTHKGNYICQDQNPGKENQANIAILVLNNTFSNALASITNIEEKIKETADSVDTINYLAGGGQDGLFFTGPNPTTPNEKIDDVPSAKKLQQRLQILNDLLKNMNGENVDKLKKFAEKAKVIQEEIIDEEIKNKKNYCLF